RRTASSSFVHRQPGHVRPGVQSFSGKEDSGGRADLSEKGPFHRERTVSPRAQREPPGAARSDMESRDARTAVGRDRPLVNPEEKLRRVCGVRIISREPVKKSCHFAPRRNLLVPTFTPWRLARESLIHTIPAR